MTASHSYCGSNSRLARLLCAVPAGRRAPLMLSAASFRPDTTLEASFAVGELRAAFVKYWETQGGGAAPIKGFQAVLDRPIPIGTVLEFRKLDIAEDVAQIEAFLSQLVQHLLKRIGELYASQQLRLFDGAMQQPKSNGKLRAAGRTIQSLRDLVDKGQKFPTIYADPPWEYENEASRAAASNHYSTMSVGQICSEPVSQLVEDSAHLHLWTTNGLLREAFEVIDAWGFTYKSCLVWIKGDIGMGNYWRVSHEYLLLGVRGNLTFRDRTLPSWIKADRTIHSRKPGIVRTLIERASPGPYLELYGREELHDSAWTVYGDRVERRLF